MIATIGPTGPEAIEVAEASVRQALQYKPATPHWAAVRSDNVKQLNAWLAQARKEQT